MLLTFSIGNTSISAGFFFGGEEPMVLNLPTHPLRGPDEYRKEIENLLEKYSIPEIPKAGVLCSVVPSHTECIEKTLASICGKKPLIISHSIIKDMKFAHKNPGEPGPDRLAAAYGAWKLYGGPVAVIDMGTATTINFVTADGLFLGGAILPGVCLMGDSLNKGTAKLPIVELAYEKPPNPMATTTSACILSGIIYGTAGAVGRLLEEAELERLEKFKVALTGGYSALVAPFLRRLDFHEPALVLKGMRLIYQKI